jgi:serine protease Do
MNKAASMLCAFVCAGLLAAPGLAQEHGPQSVADLAQALSPTVVNISTTRRIGGSGPGMSLPRAPEGSPLQQYFDQLQPPEPEREISALGSGFVIDSSGLIVTNNHVIADADEILIVYPDGETAEATIAGADRQMDLAVLKIEPDRPLVSATMGNSDAAEVGDWVMAIGNPFGLGGSVSLGIVSARNRDIDAGPYDSFIQTDAAINQGNSGGPLFDMNGEVVGINTAIIANGGRSLGVGFAIPINQARPVIEQLIQYGEMRRGWIGVGIQDVTADIASSLGFEGARGALVLSVTPDGPSNPAIHEGDIILEFDGRPVASMRDLPLIVAETTIGKEVPVKLFRGGAETEVRVTVGRLGSDEVEIASIEEIPAEDLVEPQGEPLGLSLAVIDDEIRDSFSIPAGSDGIIITEVDPASDAWSKGLREGLRIAEVNQHPVTTLEEIDELVAAAVDSGREAVLLMVVDAGGQRRFIAVRIAR